MKKIVLPSLLAFGFLLTATLMAEMRGVHPGDQAPQFTLKDSKNQEHSLKSLQGKFVVLEWVNYDCPFVKKHYREGDMQKLQKEFTEKGVVWLSICSSAKGKQGYMSPEEAQKRLEKEKAQPSLLLLDPSGKVGRSYGAKTTPHMFVLDKKGKIIYAGAIDSVVSADSKDIAGASNYVSEALNAALAGSEVKIKEKKSYGCSVKYGN